MVLSEENPIYGPFFGVMGAAAAIIFSGECFKIEFFIHCEDFPLFCIFLHSHDQLSNQMFLWNISSPGRCVWNSQIWNWYRCYVSHATWTYHEIHHPSRYGWYHCHLWISRCCADCWSSWRTLQISTIQVSYNSISYFFFCEITRPISNYFKWPMYSSRIYCLF